MLGAFLVGQKIRLTISWNAALGDSVTATDVTLTHELDGETVTLAADATDANTFVAYVTLGNPGRYIVEWVTTPPGGEASDVLYIEP